MVSWILSIVFAFAFAPNVKGYLQENTGFHEFFSKMLSERMPETLYFERVVSADFIMTLTSFLLVIVASKLVFFLLISFLSKKSHGGVRGFIDGVLGLIMGFIKGVFIVSVLLAVMIPCISLYDSGLVHIVQSWLDSSYFAGTLYDNNILVLIVSDFMV